LARLVTLVRKLSGPYGDFDDIKHSITAFHKGRFSQSMIDYRALWQGQADALSAKRFRTCSLNQGFQASWSQGT
jgi:hypothetical protein